MWDEDREAFRWPSGYYHTMSESRAIVRTYWTFDLEPTDIVSSKLIHAMAQAIEELRERCCGL